MAEREMNVKLQNARDVKSNWERNNPVLLDGELGVVFDATDDPDQVRLKIGDGTREYSDLPYFEDPTKVDKSIVGVPNGVASLDRNGVIPLSQLPDTIGGTGDSTVYLDKVPEQLGTLIYNGESQMPVWRYYDMDAFIIGGTITATDAGEYTTTFQPAEGYAWADGGRAPVFCKWAIQKKVINTKPSIEENEFTFSGESQSPTLLNCNTDEIQVDGDIAKINVGDYEVSCTPKANYCWKDGTSTPVVLAWSIAPCVRAVPVLASEHTYTGAAQSPTWENYPATGITATGDLSGVDAGMYTVTFTLSDGYVWQSE